MEREKRTYSGPLMEVDIYPVFPNGKRIPTRAPKTKPSTLEQMRYNRTQAIKKLIRLVNANFDTTDFLMHPTYSAAAAPQKEKQARRDIVNYLKRVKRKRVSEAKRLRKELAEAEHAAKQMPENSFLLSSIQKLKAAIQKLEDPFKYIYVIEKQTYKTGRYAGRTNWHFHMFMTGGLDSRTLERMWIDGMRANCNNYQPDKFGPEAAALYMSKDPQGSKRFSYSRNLTQPKKKKKDGKYTRRQVEKIAKERVDDAAFWEKRYRGYRFVHCYTRYNAHNGNWYVSAILYKTNGEPPRWDIGEWITTDHVA